MFYKRKIFAWKCLIKMDNSDQREDGSMDTSIEEYLAGQVALRNSGSELENKPASEMEENDEQSVEDYLKKFENEQKEALTDQRDELASHEDVSVEEYLKKLKADTEQGLNQQGEPPHGDEDGGMNIDDYVKQMEEESKREEDPKRQAEEAVPEEKYVY